MAFQPTHLDKDRSPYTGLTRESWIEAGQYLLEGIFRHVRDREHPVVMPRQETQITYPHASSSGEALEIERRAEIFEGLARSFLIAAPLIHIDPKMKICGISLRDYYRHQVLCTCTRGGRYCAGTYEELQELTHRTDPFRAFQQTVETCALVICLWACREEIWETYAKEEKDAVAAFLSSFAHANTVPQNWRLFNMLDLAFLKNEGYPIDEEIMLDHANAVLEYYAGDGWYRDGQCFDYYSCWAFQFYAPLWCVWYGYEHAPYLAKRFEEHSNRLMATYADFFDRDGWTNMWGRSNIYRFASVSAFDGNLLLRRSTADPGLARRIASGSLLQFLERDDFRRDGVPTMGFYRQFGPLVQGYSCAESPFWMGKAFLCLHFPEEHPFWTAKEKNGSWEGLGDGQVKETALDGPALLFSNHQANGETVLRTGKVVKERNDFHGMWNYSKLCYNTKYPWESAPAVSARDIPAGRERGGNGEALLPLQGQIESQQYVLTDLTGGYRSECNITYWAGVKEHVLYRKQCFDYRTDVETHWMQQLYLADFTVPYGIVRADKLKLYRRPVLLTLGSYGFPDNGTRVQRLEEDGARAVVLSGRDACGRERRMAMTVYGGWTDLELLFSRGTNPDSECSIVIYASARLKKQYGGCEPCVFLSQVITREDGKEFSKEELFPIERVAYTDPAGCGTYGPIRLWLKDGTERVIDYEGTEGRLSL